MDVHEAIRTRRSVRAFRKDPLPPGALEALREAILCAPSAGNLQSRVFHLVTGKETRRALGRAADEERRFATVPLVVVGSADLRIHAHYGARGVELYAIQDVSAAVENLLLAVHALGLGAVWTGAFDEAAVVRTLALPAHLRPVALVPIGVPARVPAPPARRSAEDLLVVVA